MTIIIYYDSLIFLSYDNILENWAFEAILNIQLIYVYYAYNVKLFISLLKVILQFSSVIEGTIGICETIWMVDSSCHSSIAPIVVIPWWLLLVMWRMLMRELVIN